MRSGFLVGCSCTEGALDSARQAFLPGRPAHQALLPGPWAALLSRPWALPLAQPLPHLLSPGLFTVDGRWSPWSPWSACSVTCAGGLRERLRVCNNPEPQHGGKACTGDPKQQQMCSKRRCPIGGSGARGGIKSGEWWRTRMCVMVGLGVGPGWCLLEMKPQWSSVCAYTECPDTSMLCRPWQELP